MKIGLFVFWTTIFAASLALPQATTVHKKAPPAKKSTSSGTHNSSGTHKALSSKTARSGGKAAKKPVTTWRNRQLTPTPERYKTIQEALASKGYLKEDPNGVWDAGSVEALKQFQTDQKLPPTGKINSPSLIGLGLGPRIPDEPLVPPPATLPATPAAPPPPATAPNQ